MGRYQHLLLMWNPVQWIELLRLVCYRRYGSVSLLWLDIAAKRRCQPDSTNLCPVKSD